jgi:uroporphyrinogen-III decarboxylase
MLAKELMKGALKLMKGALKFQDLPRVPVFPLCISWWAFDHFGYTVMDVFKNPEKGVDAQLKTLEILNFDAVESFWDWYCILGPLGCEMKIEEKGSPLVLDFPLKKRKIGEWIQLSNRLLSLKRKQTTIIFSGRF